MVDLSRLIEAIQLPEYRRLHATPPVHTKAEVETWVRLMETLSFDQYKGDLDAGRNAARQMNKYRVTYQRRPPASRYELIQYYLYLAVTLEDVAEILPRTLRIPVDLSKLVLGTIPSVSPNAKVIQPKGSDRILLLFNLAIVPLMAAVAYFWSQYGEIGETGTLGENIFQIKLDANIVSAGIDANPLPLERLFTIFDALIFGSLQNLPLNFERPPQPKGFVYQIYYTSMTEFVMGHEIGHFALEHLATADSEAISAGGDRATLYQLWEQEIEADLKLWGQEQAIADLKLWRQEDLKIWVQEIQADAMGMIIAQQVQEELARLGGLTGKNLEFGTLLQAFYSADLFFSVYELIEQACARCLGVTYPIAQRTSTHPSFPERRNAIYDLTVDRSAEAKPFIDESINITSGVLDLVFQKYIAHIDQSGLCDMQPSAMWRSVFGLD